MYKGERAHQRRHGFTIIELVVVIAVVSILAVVLVIGYGAWQGRIADTRLKHTLTNAAAAMENARTFQNSYPALLPTGFEASPEVELTLAAVSSSAYCIDGYLETSPADIYYVDNLIDDTGPVEGSCATRTNLPVPDMPSGFAIVSAYISKIQLAWSAAANATGYVAQCASDPAFIMDRKEKTVTTEGAEITGLSFGNTYYCRVKAVNSTGSSAWASAQVAETSDKLGGLPVATSIEGYWTTPPEGFLFEDGSAVSRTTYAALFAVIGTTYGIGDGVNTFNLPDSRGRASVNLNSADSEFNTIGELYGTKSETVSVAQMPSHTHTQNAHTHANVAHGHSISDPSHNHSQNAHNHSQNPHNHNGGFANPFVSDGSFGSIAVTAQNGAAFGFRYGNPMPSTAATNNSAAGSNDYAYTDISLGSTAATNQSTTATNQSIGGGGSHNNIQPSIVKRYAIKFSSQDTAAPSLPEGSTINGYWTTAPSGYLLEDGAAVSRTTYASLFSAIGTTHGSGDGSTTFNLPDSRGRVAVNSSASDTEFDTIGEKTGVKEVTLTISQIPAHNHTQSSHNHTQNAHTHTVSDPGHNHTQSSHNHTQNAHNHSGGYANPYVNDGNFGGASVATQGGSYYGFKLGAGASTTAVNNPATGTNQAASTGISVYSTGNGSNSSTTATNQNTGGDGAHNTIQPSIVRTSAIRASTAAQTTGSVEVGTSVGGYWSSAPAGFLYEDGSAVSRTVYANLFAVIGTTYGAGNGSTTFNLPDSRGRTSVNLNPTDTEFDTMGEKPGSKTETLSISQMPSHSHIQNAHTHTISAHTHSIYDAGHTHGQNAHNHTQVAHIHGSGYVSDGSFGGIAATSANGLSFGFRLSTDPVAWATNNSATATNNAAYTGISITSTVAANSATTATNNSNGGGGSHLNIQPSIVKRFVIKY